MAPKPKETVEQELYEQKRRKVKESQTQKGSECGTQTSFEGQWWEAESGVTGGLKTLLAAWS